MERYKGCQTRNWDFFIGFCVSRHHVRDHKVTLSGTEEPHRHGEAWPLDSVASSSWSYAHEIRSSIFVQVKDIIWCKKSKGKGQERMNETIKLNVNKHNAFRWKIQVFMVIFNLFMNKRKLSQFYCKFKSLANSIAWPTTKGTQYWCAWDWKKD